jgi:hypothetical protein
VISDLELNGPAGFALYNGSSRPYPSSEGHVIDMQADKITAPEFAVERQVEQGQVARSLRDPQGHADGPYVS